MDLSTKFLIFAFAILTLGSASFIIYQQLEFNRRQTVLENTIIQQKELIDNIVRSSSTYTTKKDLEDFAKTNSINLKAIEEDLSKLGAKLDGANRISIITPGSNTTNLSATTTTPITNPDNQSLTCHECDKYGYLANLQLLEITEPFSPQLNVPFGKVGFNASAEKPFSLEVFSREYNVVNVIAHDEDGKSTIYNKFSIKVKDKQYDTKITKAEYQEIFPEAKFSFWNPKLMLFAEGGGTFPNAQGSLKSGLAFTFLSYGKIKQTPAFLFLGLGGSYDLVQRRGNLDLHPVYLNLGELTQISFLKNTYLFPGISADLQSNLGAGLGISVSF